MNFKQFFTEAASYKYKCKVLSEATPEQIQKANKSIISSQIKPIDKGWVVQSQWLNRKYFITPNYIKHMQQYIDDSPFCIFLYPEISFENQTTDRVPGNAVTTSSIKDALKIWDMKKNLSSDTKETFKEVIDEL